MIDTLDKQLSLPQRLAQWFSRITGLAAVTVIPVGRHDDGLDLRPAGTPLDKPWAEQYADLKDAREAWRQNPLARRIIGLITSHTVGSNVLITSEYGPLKAFIETFWHHNQMDLRLAEWSDELSRAGELFPVLFTNPIDGLSKIRTVPASLIEAIDYDPEDYENEQRYKETTPPGEPDKYWIAPAHATTLDHPVMLHYSINRPLGAIRGESDLAPILPWLRRYSRWLEDRVRLNAAVRAFLWIVHAPPRLRTQLEERYRRPPEPGSVIIAEKDVEEWEAVAPNLNARDAAADGRAIRWMIVAGGPGTGLLDMGEGEDSNLATGTVMTELRRRFLRRRQSYITWLLTDIILEAYKRSQQANPIRRRVIKPSDIVIVMPDISPEDNNELASAAKEMTTSLQQLATITGNSDAYKRMAIRLFAKFAGEHLNEQEEDAIVTTGEMLHDTKTDSQPNGNSTTPTNGAGTRSAHTQLRTPRPAREIPPGPTNGT